MKDEFFSEQLDLIMTANRKFLAEQIQALEDEIKEYKKILKEITLSVELCNEAERNELEERIKLASEIIKNGGDLWTE